MTSAWGIPIVAPIEVEDIILRNAAELIAKQLSDTSLVNAKQIRDQLWQHHLKVAIYPSFKGAGAVTQLPEFRGFPYAYAYSATKAIPTIGVSDYDGDFGSTQSLQGNSITHELTHSIHLLANTALEPQFEQHLEQAFQTAIANGTWPSDAYINTNKLEYLAEGSEIWFNWKTEYAKTMDRAALKNKDPLLYSVLNNIYTAESEDFSSGSLSFIQPVFNAFYSYHVDDENLVDLDDYNVGVLVNGGQPLSVYRSKSKTRTLSHIQMNKHDGYISFDFRSIPTLDSEQISSNYRFNEYQFYIEKQNGDKLLNCVFSENQIIDELAADRNHQIDLNYLNSYCEVND